MTTFRLLKSYKKIHAFTSVISYFTMRQWQFRNDAVMNLWDSLNPIDRQIFDFNIQDMSWEEYFKVMIAGFRLHVLKDSPDTIEQARKKIKK